MVDQNASRDGRARRPRSGLATPRRRAAAPLPLPPLGDQDLADAARLLEQAAPAAALAALRALPDLADRGRLLGDLAPHRQAAIVALMERGELAAMVAVMPHDERADLFKRLDEAARESLLPALAAPERDDLRALAAHPEGTVGAVMTSDFATLDIGQTAAEAIDSLRRQAPDSETIYQAFAVGAAGDLLGAIGLRDLLLAAPDTPVAALLNRHPPVVRAGDPREAAARLIARYDLIALPVLDARDRLVGIITYDDAMDVAEAEATEDFFRAGSVAEIPLPVRRASILRLYRSRITWLIVLVFGNILSGLGIAAYESTIEAYVALVFFLPLLIASGGNAGAQSATLMVRALATGDVRAGDWASMIGREVLVALLLGGSMALAVSMIGFVRGGADIALIVSLAMIVIVLIGSLTGISLPFLLGRLRMDPAIASAPLVTSLADAMGVLVYFAIAAQILDLPA